MFKFGTSQSVEKNYWPSTTSFMSNLQCHTFLF